MADIHKLDSGAADFQARLDELLAWDNVSDKAVNDTVNDIIARIRAEGDAALVEFTNRFDGWQVEDAADLEIPVARLKLAWNSISGDQQQALAHAAERVRAYAEHQKMTSWEYEEADGILLGQQVTPLDRVGLYVPGGKAAYPSSVLMNALPAKVAGVEELIMVVPTPGGELNELVLAAAHICGVDKVFAIGGAQAVAALAWGTDTIPPVDKIVGPGNIYVATAKRAVFGQVGIDMVAGPSEILIICDGKTNPAWVAMDLFSQAEHGEDSQSMLLCPDADFIARVEEAIDELLPAMERKGIIAASLRDRGALVKVANLDEAADIANHIAAEHLELSVEEPREYAKKIKHAGAIFMGRHASEPLGDYCAGPNHVLPTSRTARFSSPLGVYDFQKRSSLIMVSEAGADTLGRTASTLARGEGLIAHALSAEYRLKP
ncbi:histidinol dehydrogenase [Thiolapillus sp.]